MGADSISYLQLEVSRKQRKTAFVCAIAEPRVEVISRPVKIEIAFFFNFFLKRYVVWSLEIILKVKE